MLRNEDRLYHVIVSFPSICANQFLILKFRKNEAICCLIGFGIGIGCCLVYRWLKNTFYTIEVDNLDSQTNHQAFNQSSKNNDKKFLVQYRNDHLNQFLHKSRIKKNPHNLKNATSTCNCCSSSINCYQNNIKNDILSRTNSKSQLNKKFQTSQLFQSTSNNDFNEPLNDVYQNLTKFLNKQFFKTFRMRQPKSKRHKYYSNNSFNIFKLSTPPTSLNTSLNFNQTSKQTPDDSSSTLFNTSKNSMHSTKLTKVNKFKSKVNSYSFCEDSLLNVNNYNNEGFCNTHIFQKTYSDNLDDYFAKENYQLNFDDDSLELFRGTSRQSTNSSYELNDLTNSKLLINPMTKSTNSVDKSLEEALLQIVRLKEDMTHLCKDIDSLYNTKASEHELNELLAKYENEVFDMNNVYSTSDSTVPFLNKYIEITQVTNNKFNQNPLNRNDKEMIQESEIVKKRNCSCMYSTFAYILNESKTNSIKSEKISSTRSSSAITGIASIEDTDLTINYADKGSQTNIDFLSTSQKTNKKYLNNKLALYSKCNKKRRKYCNLSEKYFSKRYFSKCKSLKYI